MLHHQIRSFLIIGIILLSVYFAVWLHEKFNYKYISIAECLNSYDYIIVGGGTTGCVIAAKLSENNNVTVLLVEAGGYFTFLSSIPLLAVLLQRTKYDWNYLSEPQKFSSFGYHNQRQSLPRGKGLGGSNQINFMVYGDDIKDDFNKWKSDDVSSKLGDLFYMSVRELNTTNILHNFAQNTLKNGRRWTSYHSHLQPAIERKNLHILINTHVSKVLFNKNRAIGVEILDEYNRTHTIKCHNDTILSAGTFNTPQILLFSGIGPKNVLEKHNISVVVNLPGVGRNLHDHLNVPLYVSINSTISMTTDKILKFSEFWNYFGYKEGIFSKTPNTGFIRKDNIGVLLFSMGSVDETLYRSVANLKVQTFRSQFPFSNSTSQEGFVLLCNCLKPISRGFVSIKDSNRQSVPLINPQYLSDKNDVQCLKDAIKLAIEIVNTSPFKKIGAKLHLPKISQCKQENKSDEYLECLIREIVLTTYHPGGTCKMGIIEDKFAVVDSSLRVKGTTNLKIIDASILPEPLLTFPNSVLIAIAEHAGNIILNGT